MGRYSSAPGYRPVRRPSSNECSQHMMSLCRPPGHHRTTAIAEGPHVPEWRRAVHTLSVAATCRGKACARSDQGRPRVGLPVDVSMSDPSTTTSVTTSSLGVVGDRTGTERSVQPDGRRVAPTGSARRKRGEGVAGLVTAMIAAAACDRRPEHTAVVPCSEKIIARAPRSPRSPTDQPAAVSEGGAEPPCGAVAVISSTIVRRSSALGRPHPRA